MGLFDYIFGRSKKKERLQKEHEAEQERLRVKNEKRIAEERERRMKAERERETERLAQLESTKKNAESQKVNTEKKSKNAQEQSSSKVYMQAGIAKPNPDKHPEQERISEYFKSLASQVNFALNTGKQHAAIQAMNQLFSETYAQNGHKLLNISSPHCMPVGFAFAKIAMYLDFNDKDLNSVAAENAFYCLGRNFLSTGNTFAVPCMFTLLLKFSNLLKDKLISSHCVMAEKQVSMPIGMMLGGNPFRAPHLEEFREQAFKKRVPIMFYLLKQFFDIDTSEYTIPTDMPYDIPTLV